MPGPTRRTSAFDHLRETDLPLERGDRIGTEGFSLDPFSGGTYADKPISDLPTIAENLNRTNWSWNLNNPGVLSTTDRVITYGFWNTRNDFFGTGYISDDNTSAFGEYFDFGTGANPRGAMTAAQRVAVANTIVLWDDLINVSFVQTNVADADIRYGNTNTGGAQAYAYLPFGNIFNDPAGTPQGFGNLEDVGGDVWIDYNVASNFSPLRTSYYSYTTLIHETGHALGLSHPGDYDALNDANGDGVPDPITYADDAFYAQDSAQYTVMSYFDAYETGAQHIDWSLLNFAYGSTPGVHDVAAIQRIYGADPTTRTGDTVYGFNSTADRDVFNFAVNTRPVLTIYDAGGNDTIDFSGWNTPSIIDLNAGAFSSGGGVENFLTLDQINANRAALGFAPRTQAVYDLYNSLFRDPQGLTTGLFRDNIAIAYGVTIENARGGGGNDLIIANSAANRIDGGAGNDTVSYQTATSAVVIALGADVYGAGAALGDRLISIENFIGGTGNDVVSGDARDNVIDGGAGGRDVLFGGRGNDTLSYDSSLSGVTLNLQTGRTGGGSAGDVYYEFENIIGSDFDDTLDGDSGANKIWGGSGADRIQGANGNDELYGDAGADTINGNAGDDRITGGAGADRLTGEAGNDVFIFTATDAAVDVITDFARGRDKIDLSGIDAITGTAANDAFSFIGSGAFTNVAGQVRYSGGFIYADVDGDSIADLTIQLTGNPTLTAADFVL